MDTWVDRPLVARLCGDSDVAFARRWYWTNVANSVSDLCRIFRRRGSLSQSRAGAEAGFFTDSKLALRMVLSLMRSSVAAAESVRFRHRRDIRCTAHAAYFFRVSR